jgi:putative addiction module component (TIGR02574 family)
MTDETASTREFADDESLTPEQAAELDRRCAEYDANPSNVIPWEQVEAAALARLK